MPRSVDLIVKVTVAGVDVAVETGTILLPVGTSPQHLGPSVLALVVRQEASRLVEQLSVDVPRLRDRLVAITEAEDAEAEDAERSGE